MENSTNVTKLNKTELIWHETTLWSNKQEGPFVLKRLLQINSDEEFKYLRTQMNQIRESFDTDKYHPNVLMYYSESPARVQQDTGLLRQYICYNLSEKIHWLPHALTTIEKKWLIFQILCGVAQLHSTSIVHGDIKPENILVTSYDWLFIADIHPYKPVLIKDDDLRDYNKYFGDLDNNTRCYTAPERWRSPTDQFSKDVRLEKVMDIFSAGCVIAEIMMDGQSLFDLARLQKHRRGTFDPFEELQRKIDDPLIVDLILQMIDRDPSKRPTIKQCILDWSQEVFPQSFSQVFYQLGASFQRISHLYSDNKISLIRYYIDSIYETSVGVFNVSNTLQEPIEPFIYHQLKTHDTIQVYNKLEPQIMPNFAFYNKSSSQEQMLQRLKTHSIDDNESLLLVALWLGRLHQSAFYPQSKLVALEIIQKISQHLTFQLRLNLVLPLVQTAFTSNDNEDVKIQCSSTSKIKAKALNVMLGLFRELEKSSTEEINIEALDYKVAISYIIPIIKNQMDGSKMDPLMRLTIAQNLGRLTKISARFLEISIACATRKRQEVIDSRKASKNKDKDKDHHQSILQYFQATSFGAHRSTFHGKREDMTSADTGNEMLEEDTNIPNYDAEMDSIWEKVDDFIKSISGSNNDSATMIAMLQSFIELSQIFDVGKCQNFFEQCTSCINNFKDFKVRIQVIKTLAGMSLRIGLKKIEQWVLPLTEQLLEDAEDMVILENIRLINFIVGLKLVTKQRCIKLLDQLLPFCLYPNRQIRLAVTTFVHILTPKKQQVSEKVAEVNGVKVCVQQKPLIDFDDFYCFVRPKLIGFVKEYNQNELMNYLDTPEQIMEKLREPLNLNVMRAYFNFFSKMEQRENFSIMEEQFTSRYCSVPLTDNDHFAFAALSSIFREKLKKLKNEEKKIEQNKLELQGIYDHQMYRVIKQGAIQKLATNETLKVLQIESQLKEEQKVKIVQLYSDNQENYYSQQQKVDQGTNYGLNVPIADPQLQVQSIPFEMSQVLQSLNVVPQIPETKTFKNIQQREKGDTSRFLRVNSELQMASRGAQASSIDQFDYLPLSQKVRIKVEEEHQKELQNKKEKLPPNFKPQGTLFTTLYEHKNAVNTITVTDDQQHFLTGSKIDREIHIWNVRNIQEDNNSSSKEIIRTKTSLNQICMVNNSNILAAATEKGIELYDLERILRDDSKNSLINQEMSLENDEVLQIQSMQSPITYQNLLVAAKQSGTVLIYDLRSRQCALKDDGVFSSQGGAVSAMCVGKDAFTLTFGTLGGYIATYDIRYGVVSALFKHHLSWPILALSTYRRNLPNGGYNLAGIVSTGGPQHEICQMNQETGQVEVLFRIQQQLTGAQNLSKAEIPNIPEFFRESKFKDSRFGTLKRDTNIGLFHRSLLNSSSNYFKSYLEQEGIRNIDNQYFDLSTQRFKRISEAYTCSNACRSILLPRDSFQSLMFDNETASYAITAGNDRKIRYWNIADPEQSSYQINTPNDDEVIYMSEKIQKGIKIVVEKPIGVKDFPKYTTSRIKDQSSTQYTSCSIKGKNYLVKYTTNTSYHNAIASLVQGKQQNSNANGQGQNSAPAPLDWSHIQYLEKAGYLEVNSIGGTSQGQHLNNLAITPDPIEDSTEHRISDVVSHQDAILDMAICQDMLISCSRDGLIKLWK